MKILLAIDGSGYSDAAVVTVANRLWPAGSQFRVITVIEPVPHGLDALLLPLAEQAGRMLAEDLGTMLAEATGKLRDKLGKDNVECEVITGDPKRVILQNAADYNADLVVIGAHGSDTGFSDTRLGRTADLVLAHAPCSVLLVDDDDLEALADKADRGEGLGESKFLLAIDESEHSKAVVESVLNRPWPDDSQFQVLNVVESLHEHSSGMLRLAGKKEVSDLSNQLEKSRLSAGEALVKSVAGRLKQKFPRAKVTEHVLTGNVRSMILQIAQDWPADVIFIGSHGIKGMLEFLLGSVTTAVANNAECSVEVIKVKS